MWVHLGKCICGRRAFLFGQCDRCADTSVTFGGNQCLVACPAGYYADAARMYSEAIAVDNSILSLYTNRAQAYVLLNQPDKALADCVMALRCVGVCWVRNSRGPC